MEVETTFLQSAENAQTTPEPTPWELDKLVESHSDVVRLKAKIAEWEPQITAHRERSANPAGNHNLQKLEKDVQEAKDKLAKLRVDLKPELKEKLAEAQKSSVASAVLSLRQKMAANELMTKVLDEKLKAQIQAEATTLLDSHGLVHVGRTVADDQAPFAMTTDRLAALGLDDVTEIGRAHV